MKKLILLAVIVSFMFPSFALGLSLLDRLEAQRNLYGIMALEADGNGQTYFIHFATGKKYYTGQVDTETGQAFADNKAWLGMTRADLASIPTGGSAREAPTRGELPATYEIAAEPVNQGIYGTCVAFAITRATEEAYYRATGKRIEFSEMQLWAETHAGEGEGLIARVAREQARDVGLIGAKHHPYDITPWTEETGWKEAAKTLAVSAGNAPRYRFEAHSVLGRYTGAENQIQAIKEAIMTYGHLTTSIDTIKDWQNGAIYPEREPSFNHEIILSGWNEDGWIIHNSYGENDNRGVMDYAYPMLWVYGYSFVQ